MARSPARSSVTEGRTSAASAWLTSSGPPSTRTTLRSSSSVDERTTTVVPPPQPLCTPGVVTSGSMRGAVAEAPQPDARRVVERVGREQQRVADDGFDAAHLELGRGQGHAGRDEATSTLVVRGHDDAAVVQHGRRAVGQLDPHVVAVLEQDGRLAGGGIGRQHRDVTLVPALHRQHDPLGLRPLHVDQVGQRAVIPPDLLAAAVEPEDPQADVGVGRAGGRVGVLHRRLVGL